MPLRLPTAIRFSTRTFTTQPARRLRVVDEAEPTSTEKKMSTGMDGDSSGKTMDSGANAALKSTDLGDGIHESASATTAAGQKTSGSGTSMFDKDGAVGKHFKADGAIGSTADSIGGPLAKDGAIGKNFNPDGAVGGTAQQVADKSQGSS